MLAVAPPSPTSYENVPALVRFAEYTSSSTGNDPYSPLSLFAFAADNTATGTFAVAQQIPSITTCSVTEKYRFSEPILPTNRKVTNKAMEYIAALPDNQQTRLAKNLLESIKDVILSNAEYRELIPFSELQPSMLDDGTLLFEWAYSDGRVQFFVDTDVSESYVLLLDGSKGSGVPATTEVPIDPSGVDAIAALTANFSARFA
jgi:hypothetical protein